MIASKIVEKIFVLPFFMVFIFTENIFCSGNLSECKSIFFGKEEKNSKKNQMANKIFIPIILLSQWKNQLNRIIIFSSQESSLLLDDSIFYFKELLKSNLRDSSESENEDVINFAAEHIAWKKLIYGINQATRYLITENNFFWDKSEIPFPDFTIFCSSIECFNSCEKLQFCHLKGSCNHTVPDDEKLNLSNFILIKTFSDNIAARSLKKFEGTKQLLKNSKEYIDFLSYMQKLQRRLMLYMQQNDSNNFDQHPLSQHHENLCFSWYLKQEEIIKEAEDKIHSYQPQHGIILSDLFPKLQIPLKPQQKKRVSARAVPFSLNDILKKVNNGKNIFFNHPILLSNVVAVCSTAASSSFDFRGKKTKKGEYEKKEFLDSVINFCKRLTDIRRYEEIPYKFLYVVLPIKFFDTCVLSQSLIKELLHQWNERCKEYKSILSDALKTDPIFVVGNEKKNFSEKNNHLSPNFVLTMHGAALELKKKIRRVVKKGFDLYHIRNFQMKKEIRKMLKIDGLGYDDYIRCKKGLWQNVIFYREYSYEYKRLKDEGLDQEGHFYRNLVKNRSMDQFYLDGIMHVVAEKLLNLKFMFGMNELMNCFLEKKSYSQPSSNEIPRIDDLFSEVPMICRNNHCKGVEGSGLNFSSNTSFSFLGQGETFDDKSLIEFIENYSEKPYLPHFMQSCNQNNFKKKLLKSVLKDIIGESLMASTNDLSVICCAAEIMGNMDRKFKEHLKMKYSFKEFQSTILFNFMEKDFDEIYLSKDTEKKLSKEPFNMLVKSWEKIKKNFLAGPFLRTLMDDIMNGGKYQERINIVMDRVKKSAPAPERGGQIYAQKFFPNGGKNSNLCEFGDELIFQENIQRGKVSKIVHSICDSGKNFFSKFAGLKEKIFPINSPGSIKKFEESNGKYEYSVEIGHTFTVTQLKIKNGGIKQLKRQLKEQFFDIKNYEKWLDQECKNRFFEDKNSRNIEQKNYTIDPFALVVSKKNSNKMCALYQNVSNNSFNLNEISFDKNLLEKYSSLKTMCKDNPFIAIDGRNNCGIKKELQTVVVGDKKENYSIYPSSALVIFQENSNKAHAVQICGGERTKVSNFFDTKKIYFDLALLAKYPFLENIKEAFLEKNKDGRISAITLLFNDYSGVQKKRPSMIKSDQEKNIFSENITKKNILQEINPDQREQEEEEFKDGDNREERAKRMMSQSFNYNEEDGDNGNFQVNVNRPQKNFQQNNCCSDLHCVQQNLLPSSVPSLFDLAKKEGVKLPSQRQKDSRQNNEFLQKEEQKTTGLKNVVLGKIGSVGKKIKRVASNLIELPRSVYVTCKFLIALKKGNLQNPFK